MLKKTITFDDLDGNKLTEDFYFNLSKAEIAKMELSQNGGGLTEYLKRIVNASDGAAIISTFEDILRKSYGIRGADNKSFKKSDEISDEFMSTDAYSVLFIELVTDAEASSAFVRGIVPADLAEGLDKDSLEKGMLAPTDFQLPKQPTDVVRAEVEPALMSREELLKALRTMDKGDNEPLN